MFCIYPELNNKNVVKKLHARIVGPRSILQKLGSNAYLIDLPSNISISPVFNLVDLFPYQGTFKPLVLPSSVSASTFSTLVPRVLSTAKKTPDVIVDVLDDEFIVSHPGSYLRSLVR